MNEQLIALGLGFVLGSAAKRLVRWWTETAPRIEETLDKADDVLAAKLDIPLPQSVDATWHNLVHGAVAYVNKFASDGRFWREVIRALVTRDPTKAVLLQQELLSLTWDKGIAAVEAMMSPDLKQVVNEVKENLAVKVIEANALTTGVVLPAAPIAVEGKEPVEPVRAAVRAVAPAHKPVEGPVTKDTLEKMIRESIDRQRKLGGAK